MINEFLPDFINGNFERKKQNEEEVTYAYNISKEDEKIDFNDTTINTFNKIRGLNPFPIGYSIMDGKRVKLYSSRIGNSNKEGKIGEIVNIYNDGIGIKTLDGEIIVTELQFEGKSKTLVKDYLNGIQDKNSLIGKKFSEV